MIAYPPRGSAIPTVRNGRRDDGAGLGLALSQHARLDHGGSTPNNELNEWVLQRDSVSR